jgi:hypothetical protein
MKQHFKLLLNNNFRHIQHKEVFMCFWSFAVLSVKLSDVSETQSIMKLKGLEVSPQHPQPVFLNHRQQLQRHAARSLST